MLLSRMTLTTWRRLATVSVLALVMSASAYGRRRRALASVVVILPCSNRFCARLARIRRWCDGLPPRRGPLVGVGMISPVSVWSASMRATAWSGAVSVLLVLGEAGVLVVGVDH